MDEAAKRAEDAVNDADRLLLEADRPGLAARTELARSAIDRARAGSDMLQRSAAAIATLYVGLLGLVYTTTDRGLPLVALVPAFFLALTVGSAAWYNSYLADVTIVTAPPGDGAVARQRDAVVEFSRAAHAVVSAKALVLQRAAVALMIGIVLLPSPFLTSRSGGTFDPPDPSNSGQPVELAVIHYQAEVDAARRSFDSSASAPLIGDLGAIALLGIGLAIVVAFPPLLARRSSTRRPTVRHLPAGAPPAPPSAPRE